MDEDADTFPTDVESTTANDRPCLSSSSHLACHFCGLEFDVKKTRSLRAHIEEVHIVSGTGYMCGLCCEEFTNRKAVENHMSTFHRTSKPFGCGVCGETFRLRNLLLKHIESHTQEEMSSNTVGLCYCGECFEFFDSVASLHAHTASHREQAVYVCGACGLQTQLRHVMVKHLECHVISSLLAEGKEVEVGGEDVEFETLPVVQINNSRIQSDLTGVENCVTVDHSHLVNGLVVNCSEETRIVATDSSNVPIVSINGELTENIVGEHFSADLSNNNDNNIHNENVVETVEEEAMLETAEPVHGVVDDGTTSYKCGVCNGTFSNLEEALGHAESHNEEEFNMLLQGNGTELATGVAVVEQNEELVSHESVEIEETKHSFSETIDL